LIQNEEMEANPAMRLAVGMPFAVSACRSPDQQREREQRYRERQAGDSCECSSSHAIPSLRVRRGD
jgi:hypothetical protein